jgi:pimeloyl-ACP methyl ester carboxylesterase
MRQTFVKVVNQDLRGYLPQITAPTLLVWGDEDKDTPLEHGRIMEKEIPDAGLVVFNGAGHYSYLDKLNDFNVIAAKFFEGNE